MQTRMQLVCALSLVLCLHLFHGAGSEEKVPEEESFPYNAGSDQFAETTTYQSTSSTEIDELVIVVRTQSNSLHQERAEAQTAQWEEQFKSKRPVVLRLHESWSSEGAWTVFPIIKRLSSNYPNAKWFFFCEDQTVIRFDRLLRVLSRFNAKENVFVGRELLDREPSIIHHYAFYEDIKKAIGFPDFAAGWALSRKLMTELAKRLTKHPKTTDFSIDVQHEMAMFIYDKGSGEKLTPVREFCAGIQTGSTEDKQCATNFPASLGDCDRVPLHEILFAVKTTEKYHSRLSVVKSTWGREGVFVRYFSNVSDPSIPTEDLGVPNVERGHCAKSYAILKKVISDPSYAKVKWTLLVDDDTLISVSRMQRLLACYDSNEPVFMGEVYGYGQSAGHGYPYVTLGGGMAVNKAGLTAWKQVASDCPCPSLETPDDMWIGSCLHQAGYQLTHRPEFHQAKSGEYSLGYLSRQMPVTFHKHDGVNFEKLYENELKD